MCMAVFKLFLFYDKRPRTKEDSKSRYAKPYLLVKEILNVCEKHRQQNAERI